MVAPAFNRALARYFPEFIIGPIQQQTNSIFDRWVARLVEKHCFDAVIAYENSALYTFKAAKRLGVKCILDAASLHHVDQDRYYVSRLPIWSKARVDAIKDAEILLADCILTVSELATESYRRNVDKNKCVKSVPLGVDTEMFSPGPKRQGEARPFTFAFVGAGSVLKGFDVILHAVNKLKAEGYVFQVLAAGVIDQSLFLGKQDLLQMVHRLGMISQQQLVRVYRNVDCLLVPSRFDSFAMVVAEAMACGVPAIVSNRVGAKELISDGRNGFIISAADTLALTNRMRWCLENPGPVRSMSSLARAAAERYSQRNYQRCLLTAVMEVVSS
jgi:glycosyltransferase involved in cell wall biosynthesis